MASIVGLEVNSSNNQIWQKEKLTAFFVEQTPLTEACTISSLRTYLYRVDERDLVGNVEKALRAEPNLPGVIVTSQADVRGVISRSKFFELLGTRYGVAVFYKRPIQIMMKQVAPPTILSDYSTIHEAVRTALNRSSDLIFEPILVAYETGQYRLLDIYTLLLTQSYLFAQLQQELQHINQDLEGRVERRTAALQKVNEQLNEEISERKLAEDKLQIRFRYEQALARSADSLLTALDETAVKRIWNEDDIQLMQTVARMLAAYIERQQSRAALAKARDKALQASQFKSELVAKVSHELRTPLGAIKGYAQRWVMEVSDTSPGIPKEAIPTIFEPFEQVDGSATREHSGTGLGLSIFRQLVELMGGDILLESEPGQGSVFTVLLPML